MNAFRSLAMGLDSGFNPWISLAVLFSGGALAFLAALHLYRWDAHENGKWMKNLLALFALVPYLVAFII
jgi:hypothetical protein